MEHLQTAYEAAYVALYDGYVMTEPYSQDEAGNLLYMAFVADGLRHFYYGLVRL